ncbi:MAG: hypothetical protein ACON5A_02410 [Candidatus Comchoanobacterales bacterium]
MLNKKLVASTAALLAMPALFGLVSVHAGQGPEASKGCVPFGTTGSLKYGLGSTDNHADAVHYTTGSLTFSSTCEDGASSRVTFGLGDTDPKASTDTSATSLGENVHVVAEFSAPVAEGVTVGVTHVGAGMSPNAFGEVGVTDYDSVGKTKTTNNVVDYPSYGINTQDGLFLVDGFERSELGVSGQVAGAVLNFALSNNHSGDTDQGVPNWRLSGEYGVMDGLTVKAGIAHMGKEQEYSRNGTQKAEADADTEIGKNNTDGSYALGAEYTGFDGMKVTAGYRRDKITSRKSTAEGNTGVDAVAAATAKMNMDDVSTWALGLSFTGIDGVELGADVYFAKGAFENHVTGVGSAAADAVDTPAESNGMRVNASYAVTDNVTLGAVFMNQEMIVNGGSESANSTNLTLGFKF